MPLSDMPFPPHTSDRDSTPLPSANHEAFEGNRNPTSDKKVEDEKRSKSAPIAKGREVEFQNGGAGGEDIKTPELPPNQPNIFDDPPKDDPEWRESLKALTGKEAPTEDDRDREAFEL